MLRRFFCAVIAFVLLFPAMVIADELQDAVHKLPDEALLYLYKVVIDELQSRGFAVSKADANDSVNQSLDSSIQKAASDILSSIPRPTATVTYAPLIQLTDIDTVWISNSGKRYHTIPECSNMKNPSAVSLSEAIASGRDACRDCAYWISQLEE